MKYSSILLILGALLLAGCASQSTRPGGSGMLEADDFIVSAETSGRVLSRAFDEGTSVTGGDTLVVIDPSRHRLELEAAQAGKQVAEANLVSARVQVDKAKQAESYARSERDRVAKLLKSGTATQQKSDQLEFELSQATLARRTAEANVTSLEAQVKKIDADIDRVYRSLEDCYPIAAASGTVTNKYVDAGELLSPGRPIAKIAQLDTLWVKVYLPSGEFAGVKLGDKAQVNTEAGGKVYDGSVIWTSSEAEFTPKNVQTEKSRANLVYAVKVEIPNSDGTLKIGMPVYVTIE